MQCHIIFNLDFELQFMHHLVQIQLFYHFSFELVETTPYLTFAERVAINKKKGVDYNLLEYTEMYMETDVNVLKTTEILEALKKNINFPIMNKIKKYFNYKLTVSPNFLNEKFEDFQNTGVFF